MKTAEELLVAIQAALPGAKVELLLNPSVSAQHSIVVDKADALRVAVYLREAEGLDYCSNVTGVDWPGKEITEKVKVTRLVEGVETEVEETVKRREPGCLEAVYHLFSMRNSKEGPQTPIVLRQRTGNRTDDVTVPSLTPVWRSADFQEREVFDLFGIIFEGHHDLRRLLMWDEFEDHPMRRDYVDPDDYEWEPTAHDEVLKRAQAQAAGVAE